MEITDMQNHELPISQPCACDDFNESELRWLAAFREQAK